MAGRWNCIFGGSWDFLGLYSLLFGDKHYKNVVSYNILAGAFNIVIGNWIVEPDSFD